MSPTASLAPSTFGQAWSEDVWGPTIESFTEGEVSLKLTSKGPGGGTLRVTLYDKGTSVTSDFYPEETQKVLIGVHDELTDDSMWDTIENAHRVCMKKRKAEKRELKKDRVHRLDDNQAAERVVETYKEMKVKPETELTEQEQSYYQMFGHEGKVSTEDQNRLVQSWARNKNLMTRGVYWRSVMKVDRLRRSEEDKEI